MVNNNFTLKFPKLAAHFNTTLIVQAFFLIFTKSILFLHLGLREGNETKGNLCNHLHLIVIIFCYEIGRIMDAINVTYLELTVMFIKMHLARH